MILNWKQRLVAIILLGYCVILIVNPFLNDMWKSFQVAVSLLFAITFYRMLYDKP